MRWAFPIISVAKAACLSAALALSAPVEAQSRGTIVLLFDVSNSIGHAQWALQKDAYARTLVEVPGLNTVNMVAISFGKSAKVLGVGNNRQIASIFETLNSNDVPRGATCLGWGLHAVIQLLPTLPEPVILDISGDGENNCGHSAGEVEQMLQTLELHGVTINTLFIKRLEVHPDDKQKNLDGVAYYASLVRNGGFIVVAQNFQDFYLALYEKLLGEISMLE